MKIEFLPNERGAPRKIADVELHFESGDGELNGFRLIGFAIWPGPPTAPHRLRLVWPSRHYSIDGQRRRFSLLRPLFGNAAQERLRDQILTAWAEWSLARARSSGQHQDGRSPVMTVYLLIRESQNQHGYVDTTTIGIYATEAGAIKALEEQRLEARSEGLRTVEDDDSDWEAHWRIEQHGVVETVLR